MRRHRPIAPLAFWRLSYSVSARHSAFGEALKRPLDTNTPAESSAELEASAESGARSEASSSIVTLGSPSASIEARVQRLGARLRGRARPRRRHPGDGPVILTVAAAHDIAADPSAHPRRGPCAVISGFSARWHDCDAREKLSVCGPFFRFTSMNEPSVDRKPSDPILRAAHSTAPTAAFLVFGRTDRPAGMAETPESLKAAANALFKGTRLSVFSRHVAPIRSYGGRSSHLRFPS